MEHPGKARQPCPDLSITAKLRRVKDLIYKSPVQLNILHPRPPAGVAAALKHNLGLKHADVGRLGPLRLEVVPVAGHIGF